MKGLKFLIVSVLVAFTVSVPLTATATASYVENSGVLQCNNFDEVSREGYLCDLSVSKQVKVNDGSYIEADSSVQAAQAKVGDTVTWKITVSNSSSQGQSPYGTVTVHDVLPSAVTFKSSSATTGTYSDGDWVFDLNGENLPATLEITSTAKSSGLVENTAALTDYTFNQVDPPYVDANAANNSNGAFLNVAATTTAATQTPSVPATGFVISGANPLQTLVVSLLGAAGLLALARVVRTYAVQAKSSS